MSNQCKPHIRCPSGSVAGYGSGKIAEYAKAVAYWAELWNRTPNNSEYKSYLRLCLQKVERDLRIAEISKLDMRVENGKVTEYRERVNLSFKYEGGD